MIFILPHKKDHCPALHHYAFNCKWSYNSYLKLSPAHCWGRFALDYFRFMWQVTHSCFGFIRYFIRTLTTSLDYFTAPAFVCLNKPDHLIHCICPESEVVTYTIVCCKRQAASNPIGLNLHLNLYQAWHYYVAHARENYYWILWMLSLHLGAFTLYILFLVTDWTECTIPAIPKVEWVPKYKYK